MEPSIEKILGLRPDLVITATTANRRETRDALERLGVAVYVTRTDGLAEVNRTILDVGALVGRGAEAQALVARIDAGLADVRAAVHGAGAVPALVVVWSDPLFVVGKSTYTSDLMALAGARNIAEDAGAGFPKYSLDRVLRLGPRALVVGSHSTDDGAADPVGYWRRWPELPAVRDGRLHTMDGDLLFRPGPRVVEAARALAAVLHPEMAKVGK
jgi:ABC-type Fe3+-hydroxamate transport system substrate-binding protein